MNETWRGKWAVVTGASAGIGAEFARQLASGGTNLVLTARRTDRLNDLAATLSKQNSIRAEIWKADLTDPAAPKAIFDFVQALGVEPALLVNNAGFGSHGEFALLDRRRELSMVQVNCSAVVELTHLFLRGMIPRRKGDILIVSSTASFQPVPYMATYAATKVFDRYFAEALAEEVKEYGIRVCALCPGATKSEFADVASMPMNRFKTIETADVVVRRGLDAVSGGKSSVVSGLTNRIGAEVQRLVPRRLVTTMAARMFRPEK